MPVAGLLLGAHEPARSAVVGDIGCELLGLREQCSVLRQIDDVDPLRSP